MPERYPGYDVLAKRNSPSWDDTTRAVIERRLAVPRRPRFLTEAEFDTVTAIADRIVPQSGERAPIPVAALIDEKLLLNAGDGYRRADLPPLRQAWRRGLRALDREAARAHGAPFRRLRPEQRDALLRRMQDGELHDPAWRGMPCDVFFVARMTRDIVLAYYAHPSAWSEVGFGGPASPRGYVRMGFDRRDPWEAAEAHGDDVETVRRENRHVR